jgi:hypothetical protein
MNKQELEVRLGSAESALEEARNALQAIRIWIESGKSRAAISFMEASNSVIIAEKCCNMHQRNHYGNAAVEAYLKNLPKKRKRELEKLYGPGSAVLPN